MSTDNRFFAERLFDAGFTDLVCVTPPNASLSPSSTLLPTSRGKAPGLRGAGGVYYGYDWRRIVATPELVRKWTLEGSNIGLRAGRFPGLDIDSTDARIAQLVEDIARERLGPAPVRTGRAPKRLMMYRSSDPFPKLKITGRTGDQLHVIEFLGEGQQYLIQGLHPATLLPYAWDIDPSTIGVEGLTVVTRDQVVEFFTHLEGMLALYGLTAVERTGSDRLERAAIGQDGLRAPSMLILADCVRKIPNDDAIAPSRDEYVRFAAAIKAAGVPGCEDDTFAIFAEWAGRHEKDGRIEGNPDTWAADWKRLKPPYAVGWDFLAGIARNYGFDDASLDFDAIEGWDAPPEERRDDAPPAAAKAAVYSDQWLAHEVVSRVRGLLRFVPQTGKFLVWDGARWQIDGDLAAEDMIKTELRGIAEGLVRRGAVGKEARVLEDLAVTICSNAKLNAVSALIKSDRSIAISMELLDRDPWALNTPQGIVDLRTGTLSPSNPDALCTKCTSVPVDFAREAPRWEAFLEEATGGDREMARYIQRWCGYALTGHTFEHQLTFIYGGGGNGKSVFADTVVELLGDYARVTPMDTFTVAYGEKHTTDIATLAGARLAAASETAAGKRWDDQRLKSLTGDARITARFMRQDNFTFKPSFKLLFIGNHKPELREVDDALRRRIQMMPFVVKPRVVNKRLKEELLAEEGPAILAWMVRGCALWQEEGLAPPAAVLAATEEYFDEQDAIARFLTEHTERVPDATTTTAALFQRWVEWANEEKEFVGKMKGFSSALVAKGYERWQENGTRRKGFRGIALKDRQVADFN